MRTHTAFPRILAALVSLLAILSFVPVAGAEALRPWWHLTTRSRPSYLHPGRATDEVQEVRVDSETGTYILAAKGGYAHGRYAIVPANATSAEVQSALEGEEVYGSGNVRVSESQASPGGKAYKITFVGQLESQSVAYVEALRRNANSPNLSLSEVTRGRPDGVIVVDAANLGDGYANPQAAPVTLADALPPGAKTVEIEGVINTSVNSANKLECSRVSVSCAFTGKVPIGEAGPEDYPSAVAPYESIEMRIAVKLSGVKPGALNTATVTGGEAPPVTAKRALALNSAATPFGVAAYEMDAEEPGGGPDTHAGSHPFQLTTSLMLNNVSGAVEDQPSGLAKDLNFHLPPGLIGNPQPFTRCTLSLFLSRRLGVACPPQSVVGVARVYADVEPGTTENGEVYAGKLSTDMWEFTVPVYNLEPEAGEPARFGFTIEAVEEFVPVLLDTEVRTGGDYGVTVDVKNISQTAGFLGSEVTFWGVPGDERHNNSRGDECLQAVRAATTKTGQGDCPDVEAHNPPPLLSMPTSCTGPLQTSMEAESWADRVFQSVAPVEPLTEMDACNRLPFTPSIRVTPDGTEASKPTGLNVDVHVPQDLTLNPTGLAESEVKSITVTLPEGVAINPSGGDGLEACSEGLVGFEGFREAQLEPGVSNPVFTASLPGSQGSSEALLPGVNFCANASKIGTVTIHTPLLPNPLTGFVYLADQEANPFGSLVAMYIVAQDPVSGTLVKLPGAVHLTGSGQIVSTFEDTPQLPFEDAELHFFGGERAPLTSPARCGAYTTQASFAPWSGAGAVEASSTFHVTSGPDRSPCPGASLPFDPSLTAGNTSIQAGGFSPFTMTMSREDGQQNLQAVSLKMPAGLSGLLSGVELCPEPEADQGTCGPNSQIGETTVGVGVGGDPFTVKGGKVYITGPYDGAPFGLSIVNPAKAGPFDLEKTQANHPACDCLVVRAKIEVDPVTADLTITSDNSGPYKIPTVLEGIPLQIKHVNVTVNRPSFTFNPTDCNPMAVTGSLDSSEGAVQALSVPFQATNCAVLGFKPGFKVSTAGKTSRRAGASLTVKLTYPKAPFGSQANIKSVKVDLPKQLPSNLKTLQKACLHTVFEANPSACPPGSIVGHARAITPLVPVALEGPAYFVSYGGAKFPELVIVLQGYGVTLDLHGETFINPKTNITSSTFHTIPDAPVGTFELTLPQGQNSALAANTNLCTVKGGLKMPTLFNAQNGATIKQNTPINVTGCPKAHKAKKHGKAKKAFVHGKRK